MKGRVLVAGFATRHVVESAFRAGYEVCAVDHFCDHDLCRYATETVFFEDLDELPGAIAAMCDRRPVDMLVVTSGAENLPAAVPLMGTPPDTVERFLDKFEMQRFFEALPVPVPRLTGYGEFPAMLKPRKGAGGWRNTIVRSTGEQDAWESEWPDVPYITQEVVEGVPASVSCVADGRSARAVAINEQILRGSGSSAHGFAGSVTPFAHPLSGEMVRVAEYVAASSGCIGSIGVDFMIGDGIRVIEINPRFQATLDTVEAAIGQSVFQLHIDACRGCIPGRMPVPQRYAARRILFAARDLRVGDDLSHLSPHVADIPKEGTEIEEGHAVVSVLAQGATRADALSVLDKHITTVRRYMEQW